MVHATNKSTGNDTTLVFLLSGPVYNKSASTLAFNVTPAAAGSKLKLAGGAADSALDNARAVNLQLPAAGLQLTVGPMEPSTVTGVPNKGWGRAALCTCVGSSRPASKMLASISEDVSKLRTESHCAIDATYCCFHVCWVQASEQCTCTFHNNMGAMKLRGAAARPAGLCLASQPQSMCCRT